MKHFSLFFILIFLFSCRKYNPPAENSNFPPEVQIIFTNKCATAGCHNSKSYQYAGDLDLTSWESLLRGADNGAIVIPFSDEQSSLLYFVNTYPDLGVTGTPFMPLNGYPLSRSEVLTIKSWILKGCPNNKGVIPFASNPTTRAKAYITNQGCDIVSVIDAETKLVMRYVKVGHDAALPESPHNIKVSPDGKFWYVCFANGSYFQKFDANADTLVKELNITPGSWNVIKLSSDGKTCFISDLQSNGRLVEIDLDLMKVNQTWASGLFSNPHGIAFSKTNDTVYVTAQYGNMIYRIIRSSVDVTNISLQKGVAPTLTSNLLDPHEIVMSPDYSKYFITCQASNEIRVMDAHTDTMLKAIPLGNFPLEMAISKKRNLLFVTCQEDITFNPFFKGSVYVVDMNTLTVVKKIYEKFYQPHGIAVDDTRDLLYVPSRNINTAGPAPHHTSACGGRNGFFHVIDLNTYKPIISGSEISPDPYSVDVRE